jgi:hypothetical protein
MVPQAVADVLAGTPLGILEEATLREIGAGTEAPPGPGQQNGANGGIGRDGGGGRAQIFDERQIQRVEFVGPIERDVGDVVSSLEYQRIKSHFYPLAS